MFILKCMFILYFLSFLGGIQGATERKPTISGVPGSRPRRQRARRSLGLWVTRLILDFGESALGAPSCQRLRRSCTAASSAAGPDSAQNKHLVLLAR